MEAQCISAASSGFTVVVFHFQCVRNMVTALCSQVMAFLLQSKNYSRINSHISWCGSRIYWMHPVWLLCWLDLVALIRYEINHQWDFCRKLDSRDLLYIASQFLTLYFEAVLYFHYFLWVGLCMVMDNG